MRKSLGRIFLIFLALLHINIFASTYKWSSEIDKTTAYVNEAVYLKYICEFSDQSELYTIDFDPRTDNEKYTLKLLSEREDIVNNKRVNSYEFVVFAKEAGKMVFDFEMTMKRTTQESIDSTIGGRDNDRDKEHFSKRMMRQNKLLLNVVKTNSDLVGDFSIEVKKDAIKVNAYEPFHMEIIIKGAGNFEAIKPFNFTIDGIKVFTNKPTVDIKLSKDGFSGSWSQKFAFISDVDFIIPEFKISYYSIKEKLLREIGSEQIDVKVSKAFVKEELLDVIEEEVKFSYSYFYYALTFLAGFLVAKIKFKKKIKPALKDEEFKHKVENAKSLDELAIVLALKDSQKYDEVILKIETKNSNSLKSLKKELLV